MMSIILVILLVLTLTVSTFNQKPLKHNKKVHRIYKNGYISHGLNIETGNVSQATPMDLEALSVLDYGADPTGVNDNTKAFNDALNAAFTQGGGFVYAPTGKYRFFGQITIPDGVSLVGSYLTVPQHQFPKSAPADGTVLMPEYGKGTMDINSGFITVQHSAALQGVTIYYPEQICDEKIPIIYPPTIIINQENAGIFDVELLNSYYGIYAVQSGQHFISRIQGQPIYIGLYIDESYDSGRIENVHWNPWYCNNVYYLYTQVTYGRAFVFGSSHWQYVLNTFSFGYAVGYHFIETSTGATNGNFVGISADYCTNVSVLIDASIPVNLLITNGEFTAYHNKDFAPNSTSTPVAVMVNKNFTGNVNFENTAFWGPMQYSALLFGDSKTVFSGCVFQQWDFNTPNGSPCIYSNNGNVILNGNTFQMKGQQAYFDTGTKKAIVMGNIMNGGINIKAGDGVETAITANL